MNKVQIKYVVHLIDLGETFLQLKFDATYTFKKGSDEVTDVIFLIVPLNPFSSTDKYQQASQYIQMRGDEVKRELKNRVKQNVLKSLSPERVSKTAYEATIENFASEVEEIQI